MADTNLVELFTDIADAIRTQEESEEDISALDFPQRILDLVGGGLDVDEIEYTYGVEIFEEYIPTSSPDYNIYHGLGVTPTISFIITLESLEDVISKAIELKKSIGITAMTYELNSTIKGANGHGINTSGSPASGGVNYSSYYAPNAERIRFSTQYGGFWGKVFWFAMTYKNKGEEENG